MSGKKQKTTSGLEALVDEYIQCTRPDRESELRHFQNAPTDEDAISTAALAQLPNGKRHPHQYRNPAASLKKSRRRLIANLPEIRSATSFQELIDLVERLIRPLDRM